MYLMKRSLAFLLLLCLASTTLLAQKTVHKEFKEKLEKYHQIKPQQSNTTAQNIFIDHEMAEAHWTARNTGSNGLSAMLVDDVFIDSQGRQLYLTNKSVDIYDGTNWRHLDYGEDIPHPVRSILAGLEDHTIMLTSGKVYRLSPDFSIVDSTSIAEDDSVSNSYRTGIIDGDERLWLSHAPSYDYNQQNELVLNKFGGVSVFDLSDGSLIARMDTINTDLNSGIKANGVYDFTIDNDGKVWAAVPETDSTRGGLISFGRDLRSANTYHTSNSDIPHEAVFEIEYDNNGNIWTAFSDSVQRAAYFDGSNWTSFTRSTDELTYRCSAFEIAADNQLYCGNDSTTAVYDGSTWSRMQENAAGQSFNDISAIASNSSGLTAFVKRAGSNQGTLRSGVFLRDGSEYRYISTHTDNGLFSDIIFGLAADDDGGIWATGFRGAGYFDGSDWSFYNATDGMTNSYAWRVHAASNGTVWFGNSTNGITYRQDEEFKTYTEHGTFAEAIFEDSDQNIWMGSFANNGILQYDGSEFTHHEPMPGVIGVYVTSFAEGPNGHIYAGGLTQSQNRYSIARYDGNEWSTWTPDSTEEIDPMEIASDSDNNLWFSGDSLMKWDGQNVTQIAYPREDFYTSSSHIEPDPEGNIWITYGNEVWVYNTTSSKWLNPLSELENRAYIIKHDNQGNTWIGTYSGGIYQFKRSQAVPNESEKEIPESFTLEQNYPNPFNPTTNITYNLPEAASNLTVKVYNVLGKEVATLVSAQSQRAGQHQVSFDASGLSSGVYIYRVESAQFTASKKMMLIK